MPTSMHSGKPAAVVFAMSLIWSALPIGYLAMFLDRARHWQMQTSRGEIWAGILLRIAPGKGWFRKHHHAVALVA